MDVVSFRMCVCNYVCVYMSCLLVNFLFTRVCAMCLCVYFSVRVCMLAFVLCMCVHIVKGTI